MKRRRLITIYDLIRKEGREPGGRGYGTVWQGTWGEGRMHRQADDGKPHTLTLEHLAKRRWRAGKTVRRMKRALARRSPLFKGVPWAKASPVVDVPGEITIQPKSRYLRMRFEVVGPKPRGKVRAYLEEGGKEVRMK